MKNYGRDEQTTAHEYRHPIMTFFENGHMPEDLQKISKPFCDLAEVVSKMHPSEEAVVCLRKLLEAHDCVIRAALIQKQVEENNNG